MMSLYDSSKPRTRYRSSYAMYHGKCLDAISCSVDLELATLSEPLLPVDEPAAMDKFDWIEKILIVVSVSTLLVILFSQTNEGLSLQFTVVLTLTASAIWLDLKMIDL